MQEADGGKGAASAAAELCGIALEIAPHGASSLPSGHNTNRIEISKTLSDKFSRVCIRQKYKNAARRRNSASYIRRFFCSLDFLPYSPSHRLSAGQKPRKRRRGSEPRRPFRFGKEAPLQRSSRNRPIRGSSLARPPAALTMPRMASTVSPMPPKV